MFQETQLWTQEKKNRILDSPLFHAACLQYDVAIFISSLQPSCCFMLTWRMVWKSHQRRVNPRGTCLLSFLEQIKCHELQWGYGSGTFHQPRQWEHFWHLSDVKPGTKLPPYQPQPKASMCAHTLGGQWGAMDLCRKIGSRSLRIER